MLDLKISDRLHTVSLFVRDGAILADIGTDHAYLPIYLALNNKIKLGYASDINLGPIERAKENIKRFKLEEKIFTNVASGLENIENIKPTDIAICGMGGELIAKIIDASSYVRNNKIRLILQPMTCVKELREYLQNGFSTIDENVIFEDGKLYQIICVEYDGCYHELSEVEKEIGPKNLVNKGTFVDKLINSTIVKKRKIADGMKQGGYDIINIEKEISDLEKLLWNFMICIKNYRNFILKH